MSLTKEFFVILLTTDSSLVKQPFTNRISGVEFKRLDDLEIRKNKLFNVDTEGAGTEVLMGAEKILKNIASISADLESGSKD